MTGARMKGVADKGDEKESGSPVRAQVTVAVPSFNQGRYLNQALASIFQQDIPVEVFVADAGSSDGSVEVIRRWAHRLAGWRSHADRGQAAAVNECIARGQAPYVCWINSDDWLLPGALRALVETIERSVTAPAVYGQCWNFLERNGKRKPVWVEPFNEKRLSIRCIVSQPATLIRRIAWEGVGGLDETLQMAMDYDLWWRLSRAFGPFQFFDSFVAVNRVHADTKTATLRRLHYREAMSIVRKHHGRLPMKWWLAQPYAVWLKTMTGWVSRRVRGSRSGLGKPEKAEGQSI